jgi:hypothetical protein
MNAYLSCCEIRGDCRNSCDTGLVFLLCLIYCWDLCTSNSTWELYDRTDSNGIYVARLQSLIYVPQKIY